MENGLLSLVFQFVNKQKPNLKLRATTEFVSSKTQLFSLMNLSYSTDFGNVTDLLSTATGY